MPEQPEDSQSLDLSALDFGPSWAKPGSAKKSNQQNRGSKPRPSQSHKGRNDRGPRPQNRKPRQNNDVRPPKRREQEAPLPAKVKATLMPVEAGLDNLAKEILATGRTYSVYHLCKFILASRDRFNVRFESEEGVDLIRHLSDGSVWLSQAEAFQHFRNSEAFKESYEEVVVEVEAPKGEFQVVGKCGLSGKYLGPPNFHGYQARLKEIHEGQYSHLSEEVYKSKIVMEREAESIEAWKHSVSQKTHFKSLGEDAQVLESQPELETHFWANEPSKAFATGQKAWVSGGVPGKLLSAPLLSLLKKTVFDAKNAPGELTPFLCRQLSGRQVAVFKWDKKLKAGPSRPHSLPSDIVMADRPKQIFEWIIGHTGAELPKLWEQLFPSDIEEEAKLEWYHDFHWLINEGYVILLENGKVFVAKKAVPDEAKTSPPKPKEKKVDPAVSAEKASASEVKNSDS